MNASEMKIGLKVHYQPGGGAPHPMIENGMVKSWNQAVAWVVYKCSGEWHRFEDFTGNATSLEDLHPGWIEDEKSV